MSQLIPCWFYHVVGYKTHSILAMNQTNFNSIHLARIRSTCIGIYILNPPNFTDLPNYLVAAFALFKIWTFSRYNTIFCTLLPFLFLGYLLHHVWYNCFHKWCDLPGYHTKQSISLCPGGHDNIKPITNQTQMKLKSHQLHYLKLDYFRTQHINQRPYR